MATAVKINRGNYFLHVLILPPGGTTVVNAVFADAAILTVCVYGHL